MPETILNIRDLETFGIHPLTGEACALGMRTLCDLTDSGTNIVCETLGLDREGLKDNWNSGSNGERHVKSIMVPHYCWWPFAVTALFMRRACVKIAYVPHHDLVIGYKESELVWDAGPPIVYHQNAAVGVNVYTDEVFFTVEQPTPADRLAAQYGSREHSGKHYDPGFRFFQALTGQPRRQLSSVHAMTGRTA